MDSSENPSVSQADAREVTREKLETVLQSFHRARNPHVDPMLEVKPALEAIERAHLTSDDLAAPWAPSLYYAKYDAGKESTLVLENMCPRGYRVEDFNKGLSYGQAKSAVVAIARFHAASFALETKDGASLQERFPFLYSVERAVSCFAYLVERLLPTTLGFFESRQDRQEAREGLQRFLKGKDIRLALREALTPSGKLNTLLHYDFWCNNLLVKSEGDATRSCIIDWQMLAYGPPALDVSLMIWSSLTPSVRRQYGQALRSDYWGAFTSRLAKFDVDLEALGYGRDDLDADFRAADLVSGLIMLGSTDIASGSPDREERHVEIIADLVKEGIYC
ncbi:uncharacterized protein LOC122255701 isoform X2 [Penaeus japonicus]|uniref:uncharacterized protein LOC122255701 isoform X2 n=1 Tax=Penaeus japonicus TaxID=27405 RepID=UPI001C70BBE9|nr:uncharacterized protein LOC122255701 isoform X2 [Penaeus japonicus]